MTTPVAGVGRGTVISWTGTVTIWAGAGMTWAWECSITNFPTLIMPKNAKKAKCDRSTDRPTRDAHDKNRFRK